MAREQVGALARAGCRWIQLRGKDLSPGDFCGWACEAVAAAREWEVSVVVNDRADVALLAGAAGVHLGQEDLSPDAARRLLGPAALIGLSTHSEDEARRGQKDPVDYLAIGPVFPTRSKESRYPPVGPEGLAAVRRVVSKPLVAIGGINASNAGAIRSAGADAMAVISALYETADLEREARKLLAAWRWEE
jgi:thiamine-phosphate pyrophosphorylase